MRPSLAIFTLFAGMLLFLTSCQPLSRLFDRQEPVEPVGDQHYYELDNELEKDPVIEEWLLPYRESLDHEFDERIVSLMGSLELWRGGRPVGTLGFLAADMIRFRAAHLHQEYVHLGLINHESLRAEFRDGELTLQNLYELMPSDQTLVILTLTGEQVVELSREIAEKGGAPVSGMRMSISDGEPRGVLVNAEVVEKDRTYKLATTSFLANRGGFASITEPIDRIEFPVLIRDLFRDYLMDRNYIEPLFDHRIRTL
ncbi:MAG: 5'-nucleotidase [Balneolaceae bacterium]